MENRKERDVEDILDFIKEKWQLSVNELETLESVFYVFAAQDVNMIQNIQYLVNDRHKELLEDLCQVTIENYARKNFDLISSDDEDELVWSLKKMNYNFIEEVSDEEMINSLEADGWKVVMIESEIVTEYDYVDDVYFREIWNKFESLDWAGRKELRDKIVDYGR
jgi:hypothetical protein